MKERPIIFNIEMVRAILDGLKTQTRRVIKPQPQGADMVSLKDGVLYAQYNIGCKKIKCPYGSPGDRLWVRETWRPVMVTWPDRYFGIQFRADDKIKKYKNDGETHKPGWRPSIHMPKKYSRITLEITDIRVERVQDISIVDMHAEGLMPKTISLRNDWADLWDSITAKRGYSWESNPWVWVVEFEKAVTQ